MDSDSVLRFDLSANRYEESTIDAVERHADVGSAADEGDPQEEADNAEDDERDVENEDQEEGEGEAEQ